MLAAEQLLVLAPAPIAAAALLQEVGEPVASGYRWFPGAAVFAVLLAALHLAAPWVRRLLQPRSAAVGSLGAGMAVAYVFVHLLPELDKGHAVFGRMIFALSLASFVAYYGIEEWLRQRSRQRQAPAASPGSFRVKLIQLWIYNALIVYGTPAEAMESGWRCVPLVLGLGLHLAHCDFSIGCEHPKRFDAVGRYALATAPLAGWVAALLEQKTNETYNDIVVAVLAGTLLYNTFKEELPEPHESRFRWFLGGVVGFVAFAALAAT